MSLLLCHMTAWSWLVTSMMHQWQLSHLVTSPCPFLSLKWGVKEKRKEIEKSKSKIRETLDKRLEIKRNKSTIFDSDKDGSIFQDWLQDWNRFSDEIY